MITKTKTALIAAFVLGTASAALAQGTDGLQGENLRNPNAPVPLYQHQQQVPAPDVRLIEGRNVGVRQALPAAPVGQRAFDERLTIYSGPNAY